MTKTNAVRLLENAGVQFNTCEYSTLDGDVSGVGVAIKLGKEPDFERAKVEAADPNTIRVSHSEVMEKLKQQRCIKDMGTVHPDIKPYEQTKEWRNA